MPGAHGGGAGIEGEPGPNRRRPCVSEKNLGRGPLRNREPPESLKQGKGVCSFHWQYGGRTGVSVIWKHLCVHLHPHFPSSGLACDVLMSRIVLFVLISMPP